MKPAYSFEHLIQPAPVHLRLGGPSSTATACNRRDTLAAVAEAAFTLAPARCGRCCSVFGTMEIARAARAAREADFDGGR